MTRPITIEQPAGSVLARCILQLDQPSPPEQFVDPNPTLRSLALHDALEREPRLWKYPPEFYRDHFLLPAIERVHGTQAARDLNPALALEMAELFQRDLMHQATASQRRAAAKPRRNAALVDGLILAAWHTLKRPWLSESAVYEAVAEVLGPGIHAKVIRDRIASILRDLASMGPERVNACLLGALRLRDSLNGIRFELPQRYSLEKKRSRQKYQAKARPRGGNARY